MSLEDNLRNLKIDTSSPSRRKPPREPRKKLTPTALLNYSVGVIELLGGMWLYSVAYRAHPRVVHDCTANLAVAELYVMGVGVMIRGLVLIVAGLGIVYGYTWGIILTVAMALLSIGAGIQACRETGEPLAFLPIIYGLLALVAAACESQRFFK
ncbi:hypothetical protein Pan97_11040 [Bremerella volcania]|uniref:Uncharacterized protein n=1 Tax=Bremerella volcania TaxID=2527984 RepID=A0A518C4E0_9BACT|nr:hypothetical protein [Bremerella volcania]QDU74099.1 hypothetical protein Pan97_11040 [Bremerella volcania]